jgi:hypothetical protein
VLFCVSSIFLFQYLHLQLSALTLLLSMQHNRINKYIEIVNIRLSPKTTPQPIISLHVTAASFCCLKHFPGSQYHTMATKIFSSIREKNISVIWILITFLHVKTQVHTTTKCWNRHYLSNFKFIYFVGAIPHIATWPLTVPRSVIGRLSQPITARSPTRQRV